MVYISAPNYRIARLAAQDMKLPNTQWTYISEAYAWRGMRGSSIVIVDTSRYTPSTRELEKMRELDELINAYENEVLEWIV